MTTFVCVATCVQNETMLSASSSNCSVQNKKIRNKKYYEDNKENLKNSKVRFQLNLEVKKQKGDWLNAIKTKIAFVKDQLHLSTKNTRAANAHLMEALLDNWLKNNHIPLEKNTSDEFVDQLHPSKAVPLPPEEKMEVELPELPSEMLRTKTQLHSQCRENDDIYLVCGSAIERLFLYLTEEHSLICQCGERFDFSTFKVDRVTKNNHCCKVVVECMAEEKHTLEWFSSSIISGKYYVNLR